MAQFRNTTVNTDLTVSGNLTAVTVDTASNITVSGSVLKNSSDVFTTATNSLNTITNSLYGKLTWTQLGNVAGGSTKTVTVSNLSSYNEVMITTHVNNSSGQNRILASTVIPVSHLIQYTTDNGNGSHQAHYNDTYGTGISYLGSNQIKLYSKTSSLCRLFIR